MKIPAIQASRFSSKLACEPLSSFQVKAMNTISTEQLHAWKHSKHEMNEKKVKMYLNNFHITFPSKLTVQL